MRTRASDFAKIKNNFSTTEPLIYRKIRTLSLGNGKIRTIICVSIIKNKLRAFEPHFSSKIKNNRASTQFYWFLKKIRVGSNCPHFL